MATPAFVLPLPILQLVHLHILEYPLANNPEYDQHVFNPSVRGLRDRTKIMEDICFYLVGKVEGKREQAKTILPTYPCIQPSDTVAFRTSLAKYLEGLRHGAIRPNTETRKVAWWWRDVILRKSLLEECAGERFERLLLSLSTHALLRGTPNSIISNPLNLETASSLLLATPQTYTKLLSSSQFVRRTWEHSASLLLQRQTDIQLLRERLASPASTLTAKYDYLTTDRLLSLVDSRLQDLLRRMWRGKEGQRAFEVFVGLAGLKPAATVSHTPLPSATEMNGTHPENGMNTSPPVSSPPPPPLPAVAARHPSNLRKLRIPMLSAPPSSIPLTTSQSSTSVARHQVHTHAEIALSGDRDAEQGVQQALLDALGREKRIGEELAEMINKQKEETKSKSGETRKRFEIDLWEDNATNIDFKTQPSSEQISSLDLNIPQADYQTDLESRIDYIRECLLPSFPPIPSASSSSLRPPSDPTKTSISLQQPETPRRLLTSTPPVSVKPRSAYARKVVATPLAHKVAHVVGGGNARRKSRRSVRMSLALMRRPSMFPQDAVDEHDYEVDNIVDAVQDHSTSFGEEDTYRTPKTKGIIITGPRSTVKKSVPRPSFKIIERASLAPLPDPSFQFQDDSGEHQGDWTDDDGGGEEGEDTYEGKSMTLRDILLQAGDTTQFDLLGYEQDGMEEAEESFDWN